MSTFRSMDKIEAIKCTFMVFMIWLFLFKERYGVVSKDDEVGIFMRAMQDGANRGPSISTN